MTSRGRKFLIKPLVILIAAMALEGCISQTPDDTGRQRRRRSAARR